MDDFLDDLDDDLLEAQMQAMQMEEQKVPQQQPPSEAPEHDGRRIERITNFMLTNHAENPSWKCIDGETFIIKEKIGQGAFCKVKHATGQVYRNIPNKETGVEQEVEGEQQMAFKIFNRKKLKGQKTSDYDPITGVLRMSDQLKTIQEEISVWERSNHPNVVKIFSLYDDTTIPDMYLLMELAKYG